MQKYIKIIRTIKKKLLNKYIFIALNNLDVKGNHFTPQYLYTEDILNLNIVKYENIDSDFSNLMKKYNLDIKLNGRVNVSCGYFCFDDLSKESIQLINKVYYNDFKMFNYKVIKE